MPGELALEKADGGEPKEMGDEHHLAEGQGNRKEEILSRGDQTHDDCRRTAPTEFVKKGREKRTTQIAGSFANEEKQQTGRRGRLFEKHSHGRSGDCLRPARTDGTHLPGGER